MLLVTSVFIQWIENAISNFNCCCCYYYYCCCCCCCCYCYCYCYNLCTDVNLIWIIMISFARRFSNYNEFNNESKKDKIMRNR